MHPQSEDTTDTDEPTPVGFTVLGPEDFPIQPDPFPTIAAARAGLTAFVARYAEQGYYSAPGIKIALEVLPRLCRIVNDSLEDPAARCALVSEVYSSVLNNIECFSAEPTLAADMVYLLAAIAAEPDLERQMNYVDWSHENHNAETLALFRSIFPEDHPVWLHILIET